MLLYGVRIMLFTVYDPKGEKFEVAAHIAKVLIIEHGWDISEKTPAKEEETKSQEKATVKTSSK